MVSSALRTAAAALLGTAIWVSAGAGSASASTVITFDHVSTLVDAWVPNGYNGLDWTNFSTLDPVAADDTPSGYAAALTSGKWVAFNAFGTPASFSATKFDLIGANIAAAWSDDLQLTVTGYKNGVVLHSVVLTLSSTSLLAAVFNWTGLDEVSFSAAGGTPNPSYDGKFGTEFAIDDLELNHVVPAVAATPIPGSLPLLLTGFGVIGAIATKRPRRTVGGNAQA